MVTQICNLCTWRLKQEDCFWSETTLGYSRRQTKIKYSISTTANLKVAMDIRNHKPNSGELEEVCK